MTDYNNLSDNDLIDLLRSDNHIAFTHIFKRYRTISFTFAYRRLGDKELVKDIIHELFADLWENRLSLHIAGAFQAYLFTVLKNKILNHYKHKKVSQRYLAHFKEYLNQEQTDADHLARNNDLSALIEKEVAALPEKMRLAFELSRKKSLTRKEIAVQLNLPEETIKSRIRHALKILKHRLRVVMTVFIYLASLKLTT